MHKERRVAPEPCNMCSRLCPRKALNHQKEAFLYALSLSKTSACRSHLTLRRPTPGSTVCSTWRCLGAVLAHRLELLPAVVEQLVSKGPGLS